MINAMRQILLIFEIIAILLLSSCHAQLLEQASISYQKHHDYTSLETIYRHLTKGMKRTDIERLLGEPDYSPIEGQYYYSSDREDYLENGTVDQNKVSVGVVLDYNNDEGILTDELQMFWLGPIGE